MPLPKAPTKPATLLDPKSPAIELAQRRPVSGRSPVQPVALKPALAPAEMRRAELPAPDPGLTLVESRTPARQDRRGAAFHQR